VKLSLESRQDRQDLPEQFMLLSMMQENLCEGEWHCGGKEWDSQRTGRLMVAVKRPSEAEYFIGTNSVHATKSPVMKTSSPPQDFSHTKVCEGDTRRWLLNSPCPRNKLITGLVSSYGSNASSLRG
jgi:hypothetical protein